MTEILKLERGGLGGTPLRRFHGTAVRAGDELDIALRDLPAAQQTTEVLDAVIAIEDALRRLRHAIIATAIETGEAEWR